MKTLPSPPVGVSLLVLAPASEQACVAAVETYEEYVRSHGPLRTFLDTLREYSRDFDPGCVSYPREALLPRIADGSSFYAHGGEDKRPTASYVLASLSTESRRPVMIKLSWEVSLWASRWDDFADTVTRVVERFDYWHAYAGFSFAQLFWPQFIRARATLTARYRCVDWDEVIGLEQKAYEGVRSPSWLTFVGEPFISRLVPGALDGITSAPVGRGVVFRVGPAPILGDVNAEEDLTGYHRLGRYLAPVAMSRQRGIWSNGGDNGWAARFDR